MDEHAMDLQIEEETYSQNNDDEDENYTQTREDYEADRADKDRKIDMED